MHNALFKQTNNFTPFEAWKDGIRLAVSIGSPTWSLASILLEQTMHQLSRIDFSFIFKAIVLRYLLICGIVVTAYSLGASQLFQSKSEPSLNFAHILLSGIVARLTSQALCFFMPIFLSRPFIRDTKMMLLASFLWSSLLFACFGHPSLIQFLVDAYCGFVICYIGFRKHFSLLNTIAFTFFHNISAIACWCLIRFL